MIPYNALEELPAGLQRTLPIQAQKIYQEAFNNAWEIYADKNKRGLASREEVSHRVAWSAVKRQYYKNLKNAWRRKEEV